MDPRLPRIARGFGLSGLIGLMGIAGSAYLLLRPDGGDGVVAAVIGVLAVIGVGWSVTALIRNDRASRNRH